MTAKVLRDGMLFLVGLAGVVNEGWLRTGEPRFHLLVVYMALLGIPAFDPAAIAKAIGQVARRNGNGNENTERAPGTLAFARLVGRIA